MSDEKPKRNKLSFTKNEDKILSRDNAPIDSPPEEPTRQFTAAPAEDEQTKIKPAPETKPTEIFSDVEAEPTKILTETELQNASEFLPDENLLRPNRLRFALICLLFAFVAGWSVINLV